MVTAGAQADGNPGAAFVLIRASGSGNNAYCAWLGTGGGTTALYVGKMTGGSISGVVSSPAFAATIGTRYILWFSAIGTNMTAQIAAESAPGTILGTATLTDSTYTSGVAGLAPNGIYHSPVSHFAVFTGVSSAVPIPFVTATPAAPPAPPRALGINVGFINNYTPEFAFADAIRHSGKFGTPAQPYAAGTCPVDANGYPTTDFGIALTAGVATAYHDGQYAVVFPGKATVGPTLCTATVVSNTWNSSTNSSVVLINLPAGQSQFTLAFTNTRRLPTDTAATGLAKVQVMRPIAQGSSISHNPTETFNRAWLTMVAPFHHLRFLDWSNAVNGYGPPTVRTPLAWSSRTLPAAPDQTQANVDGTAYEHMIASVNANPNPAKRNVWINIPTWRRTTTSPSFAT